MTRIPCLTAPWIALLVLLTSPGCKSPRQRLEDGSMARIVGLNLDGLSPTGATLLFDLEVENPYDTALRLDGVSYELTSGGKPFLSGAAATPGAIPAAATRIVKVPVKLDFAELVGLLDGARLGSVIPYEGQLGLDLSSGGLGLPRVPIRAAGELPLPLAPEVAIESIEWESLSLSKAAALLSVRLWNRNEFPIDLSRISYALVLNGVRVAQSALAESASLAPGTDQAIELRTSFSPQSFGLAFLNVLMGKGAQYEMSGTMGLTTPYGAVTAPFRKAGETRFGGAAATAEGERLQKLERRARVQAASGPDGPGGQH